MQVFQARSTSLLSLAVILARVWFRRLTKHDLEHVQRAL